MKLSEFREAVIDRYIVFKACAVFTFQKETAYWLDNWASVLSTTFYTVSMLVFIHVLYGNVKTVAGYTKNDMLLFFLVAQISFYSSWAISAQNMQEFILDVNRGDLDLILTKPMPALFYITFKRIRFFSGIIRDGLPPTLAIVFSINWSALHFSTNDIFFGVVLFILGEICLHVLQFLASIPVIWLGESLSILKLAFDVEYFAGRYAPLEGFSTNFRLIFSTILPVMIVTGFTTSVLLGKSNGAILIFWSFIVTVCALFVRAWVWGLALRSYTSASS